MNFCTSCGHALHTSIPPNDNRERHCCSRCNAIHYINPKMVLGTIPVWQGQVLLCKRAIEPRYGYWTLPAGFMEINESIHDGALRETQEEAGANIKLGAPFSIFDVKTAQQIHMFFRAELLDTHFAPGIESLDVQLFHESSIPWNDLAFKTVSKTLQLYFQDAQTGQFGLHTGDLYDPISWRSNAFSTPTRLQHMV